jgi:hypothetical protein
VVAGFVTLLVAALAWPLLARFMPFTSAGAGHSALAGLVSTGAGLLAGRRMTGGAVAGPAGQPGPGYASVLEAQNDAALAARSARAAGLTPFPAGGAGAGAGATGRATGAAGGLAGGVGAAVGAAATMAAGMVDHVESQLTSTAADAGLGHATRPTGGYGHTRGRFGGPHHRHRHDDRHAGTRGPGAARADQDTDTSVDAARVDTSADTAGAADTGTGHVPGHGGVGGSPAVDPAGVEVEPDGTRP